MTGQVWRVGVVLLGAAPAVMAQAPDTPPARQLPSLTVEAVRQRSVAPPVATRMVDSTVLRKAQAANSWDLVRRTAGVEVHEQGQGPGFAANAVLRGFTSDHSSDLLLTIDGVPVNLPLHGHVEGYSDWNVVFPAAADGLRVISGPASPLYGDFAFGGVVELTTAWGTNRPAGALGGSSYGDGQGWLKAGGVRGDQGWLVGGRFERSQGWRDHSGFRIGNGILRWRAGSGRGRLEGGVIGYATGWDSPGFLSVANYNAGRLTGSGDPTDGGSAHRVIGHLRYTRVLSPTAGFSALGWVQGIRSRVFLNIPEGDGPPAQTDESDRRTAAGGEAQTHWSAGGGELSLGASGRYDDVGYRLLGTVARAVHDSEAIYDGSFAAAAAFTRWRRLVGPVAFDVGLRWDLLHYRSINSLAGPGPLAQTHRLVSPKLGARYLLGGNLAIAASLSRGFRGSPGVIGEPARRPMRAWAKELGAEFSPGDARIRLALFRLDVAGERIQDPVTREISGAGRSVRQGAEGSIDAPLVGRLRLTASATINDATISEALAPAEVLAVLAVTRHDPPRPSFHLEPLVPGDPVPGVSRYLARFGLDLELFHGATIGGLVRLNGPFTPIGEPTVRTRPYTLVDATGTIAFGRAGWAMDWELQNVLNTRYPEVRASGYLNPGAPRVLRVAIRFQQ